MAKEKRGWVMVNLDTGDVIEGQFEATGLSVSGGAAYTQIQALNRQTPILQFARGDLETVRFEARLFAASGSDPAALRELRLLRLWRQRDEGLGRPPVLSFTVGDGHVAIDQCVLTNVEEAHDRPQADGQFRGARVQLSLARYKPFSIEGGEPTESRYHRSKRRDYYEMLAQREYGDPLLGDVLRARNPDKPILEVGDVVKLPSARAIATEALGPRSVPFDTAFGKQDTPQRRRFREALEARSTPLISYVLRS